MMLFSVQDFSRQGVLAQFPVELPGIPVERARQPNPHISGR